MSEVLRELVVALSLNSDNFNRNLRTINQQIKAGWRMQEIDGMDMLGFLRLHAWDAQREHISQEPKAA